MLNPQTSTDSAATDLEEIDNETVDQLWSAIMNGATLKDLRNVSNEVMEGIYAYAYQFYQQGRFKEAEVFFRFLCLYDMYNADYAMGLGATFHQSKKYQKAMEAYTLAFTLGKDHRAVFHAAQCALLKKSPTQARQLFNAIVESDRATAPLKAQAQAYLVSIPAESAESADQPTTPTTASEEESHA